MKVSTKLYASVGALLAAGMLVAVLGVWRLRALGGELDEAINTIAVKVDQVNSLRARNWEMVASMRAAFAFASVQNPAGVDDSMNHWKAAYMEANEIVSGMRPLLTTDQDRGLLARFESSLGDSEKLAVECMQLCRQGKFGQVAPIAAKAAATVGETDTTLREFRDLQMRLLKEADARAGSDRAHSSIAIILVSCLMLASGAAGIVVVRGMSRTAVQAVVELSESAQRGVSAATQVSGSSQSLAQGSSEQAASLEETSASSEQVSAMARKESENTRGAVDLVTQSRRKLDQTNQSLEQTVAAMGEVNSRSGKISKVIKVIDEIAFQTNILALNAAVETARAGDAGMGFAVVADDVRNLAQRCAQAAKDTAALIEESIAKSNGGKMHLDQAARAIREIAEDSARLKTLVDEVNLGSQEQVRGAEQIGKAITRMEQVAQRTAANAEESAGAAED